MHSGQRENFPEWIFTSTLRREACLACEDDGACERCYIVDFTMFRYPDLRIVTAKRF